MTESRNPPNSLLWAIAFRLCPNCRAGKIYRDLFQMNFRCPHCDLNFFPEPGFYLGAMMVPYFLSAMTTVPFAVALKVMGLDVAELITWMAVFYIITTTVFLRYSKVVWLHIEFVVSDKLKLDQ